MKHEKYFDNIISLLWTQLNAEGQSFNVKIYFYDNWRLVTGPSLALVSPLSVDIETRSQNLFLVSPVSWLLSRVLTFALVSASHCVAHNYNLDKETINWLSCNLHPGPSPDADIISGSLMDH